jgi:hypothetical protein
MPVGKHMGHINILLLFFGAIQFNCSESLITKVVNGVWRLSLDRLRNNQLSNLPIIFQVVFGYIRHSWIHETLNGINRNLNFGQLKHHRFTQTCEELRCVIHQQIHNNISIKILGFAGQT